MTVATGDQADVLRQSVRLVLAMLAQDRNPTQDEVDGACKMVYGMQLGRNMELDHVRLQREVEALVAVVQEESTGLYEDQRTSDHIEWLTEAKAETDWVFWERYRRYQEDVKQMPPTVIRQLDRTAEKILRQLESPERPGTWWRSGLVVGQVQSGKTGNFIGLLCKAVDAGYKLVVVLAGTQNSLRSQTQLRVDEGLLGFDTQFLRRTEPGSEKSMGVGSLPGAAQPDIGCVTTSAENGDFRLTNNANMPIGRDPVVLVIKKHPKILGYVRRWITEAVGTLGPDGRRVVESMPLLVIDDEADYASVDTTKDDAPDPSAVNAAIRDLMSYLRRSAYVGYTATPFANIFIDHHAEHDLLGADLFPQAFIECLKSPSNYFGPQKVFGVSGLGGDELDTEPLPVLREIVDWSTWMPDKHKKTWTPTRELPTSLRTAIDSFVLACAARRARGQHAVHNSMLVHVTRFRDVQDLVTEDVQDFVELMRSQLHDTHSAVARATVLRLRRLWESDFEPTTRAFDPAEAERTTWTQVESELLAVLDRVETRKINGTSKDALAYYENRRNGLTVIAVGGDKLSRGLTLEGLTVSYYLRSSNTYDTLLQMGRWFGYRPQFEDLCRVFTTGSLMRLYGDAVLAEDELRREFDEMAAREMTPMQFGLRVRGSQQLDVTAPNKMRRSELLRFSFSLDIPETVAFSLHPRDLDNNIGTLDEFVRSLGTPNAATRSRPLVWSGVHPDLVVDAFLRRYTALPRSWRVRPAFIADYVDKSVHEYGELTSWTVCLVTNSKPAYSHDVAGHDVGLVRRRRRTPPTADEPYAYSTRRLVSPSDEVLGITESQAKAALAESPDVKRKRPDGSTYTERPSIPSGWAVRRQRAVNQPLLLVYLAENPLNSEQQPPPATPLPPVVGFAISFPKSPHAAEVTYRVNSVWLEQEFGDDFGEDEE